MEKQKTTRKPEQKETLAQPKVKVLQKKAAGSVATPTLVCIIRNVKV